MIPISIRQLISTINGKFIGKKFDNADFAGNFSIDTRTLKNDDIFIAIIGERFDGNDFIEEAFKKGASFVISSRPNINNEQIIEVENTNTALQKIASFLIKKINPKIIYCSNSGFGTTGPYAKRGGFDLIAQGMSGLMSITGHKNSPPVKVGVPIADLNTGMFAMQGILSAYIHRLKNDEGQFMEVSLLESALAYTLYESSIYFTTGDIPEPDGSSHRLTAPYQAFKTKDGYINLGAANQSNWERLLDALNISNLKNDQRFINSEKRQINRKELEKLLEKIFTTKNSDEWIALLLENGIPSGPILDMKQVWEDDQVKSRNMDVKIDHPNKKDSRNIGIAVKLHGTPGQIKSPAPLYGQHTQEILRELDYSLEEIQNLKNNNIAGMTE